MDLEILKKQYNKTLVRAIKSEEYMNNSTMEQFDKWLPEFNKITMELSQMMKDYKRLAGTEMTSEEIVNGFRQDVNS